MPRNEVVLCEDCGSHKLQHEVWIETNTDKVVDPCNGRLFCSDCDHDARGIFLMRCEHTGKWFERFVFSWEPPAQKPLRTIREWIRHIRKERS